MIACEKMINELKVKASEILNESLESLGHENGFFFSRNNINLKVPYEEIAHYIKEKGEKLPETEGYFLMPTADIKIKDAFGLPHHIFAFSAHSVLVEVNTLTGEVSVLEGAEAVDGGVIINMQGYEAQVEGGFVMGMGYGLMEHVQIEMGFFKNINFSTYIIPSIKDVPMEVKAIPVINPEDTGPYRSKGIAETVMVATAPAITNAIHNALGIRVFGIPANSETVYKLIKEKKVFND